MSGVPLLEIAGLEVRYELVAGPVLAVRDVSLTLRPGQRLGLVGESGSGKTTVALAVMGLLRPPGHVAAGSIRLDGQELVGLHPAAHAAMRLSKVAYVPQGAMNSLNPVLRIGTSIGHALAAHGIRLSRAALDAKVAGLLDRVGLPGAVAARYPHELSGGMKQRVCIAIAISLGPRLIIADEPTSALDVVTQRQVMQTLRAAQEALGSAMILIGHDMGLMAQSVDSMAVMREGHLEEEGAAGVIFSRPAHPYTAELIRSVPVVGGPSKGSKVPDPGTEAQPLLAFEAAGKSYGGGLFGRGAIPALHPLSFSLPATAARIVAVVGQSGSGKTTLGNMALGFTPASTGSVRFAGQDVTGMRGAARLGFRRAVQAVFQDPYSAFNPFYRVGRSLMVPLLQLGVAADRAEARATMEIACRHVGLDPALLDRFAHELSGGQRQRLMVARALTLRPRLLVADEPVSMVDASLRAAILDLLVELRDRHRISILYITHDLATAYAVSDSVLVLHRGRVVEAGDPAEVFVSPAHPYTRLLIDCLPWPDPEHPWGNPVEEAALQREIKDAEGDPPVLRPGAGRLALQCPGLSISR